MDHRSSVSWVVLSVSALVGVAVGLACLSWRALAATETAALALVLTVPMVWLLARRESLVQPATAFSLTALGYVGGAVFLQTGGQSITYGYQLISSNLPFFALALGYASLGSAAFYAGYLLTRAPLEPVMSARSPERPGGFRLFVAISILSAVGLIGYVFFVESSGGLLHLIRNINRRGSLRSSDYGRALFQFLQVASWIWFCSDAKAPRKPLFWIHGSAVLLMLGTFGARTGVVLHLIVFLALVAMRPRHTRWHPARVFRWALAGAMVATLLATVMVGFLVWRRSAARTEGRGLDPIELQIAFEEIVDPEYLLAASLGQGNAASIETLATLVEFVPDRTPRLYGASLAAVPLAAIPRSVWPDKPVNLGLQLNRIVEDPGTATGRPISWIGELYWNFGGFGVFLGCLAFGIVSGRASAWYARFRSVPLVRVAYATYVVYFTAILTKVELKTAVNRTGFYLLAIALAYWILGKRATVRRSDSVWRIEPLDANSAKGV